MPLEADVTLGLGISAVVGAFLLGRWSVEGTEAPKDRVEGERNLKEPQIEEKEESKFDFSKLSFDYVETNGYVQQKYIRSEERWTAQKFVKGSYTNTHVMACVFHYGMSLFEGLKAYRLKDGRTAIFNPQASIDRMNKGCARLMIPEIPSDLYMSAMETAVRENIDFVPPYGIDGALYVRPVVYGSGGGMRSHEPPPTYTFNVIVCPTGKHPSGGRDLGKAKVARGYDRAAPKGVGNIKIGGNYAADRLPATTNIKAGYPNTLYLDSKEQKYIDEFSTSNFIAIDKDGHFVTPDSDSILPSNTNKVLQQLAKDNGIEVEVRPISWEEVSSLKEVAGCGTSLIVKPIGTIQNGDELVQFETCDTLLELRSQLQAIQKGEADDTHGWMHFIDV